MTETVHTRLESTFTDYRIVRQLHDVPPHEVFEVVVDGTRSVYKGDTGPTGSATTEGRVIEFVGRETSVPVPDIHHVGDGWYLAAWDPAAPSPDEEYEPDRSWATAAGRGLARLHRETESLLDGYGAFRPVAAGLTTSGHDEFHAAALEYLRDRRQVLARYGHEDVADRVVDFFEGRPDAFDGADGPVCCHGWATPEHVAVEDGAVACMVDFEHAIAAPSEFDYWRTVVPAFGLGKPNPTTDAFRAGYESVRPLPDGMSRRKPYYRLLNAVYYFESLYVQDQHGPSETAERAKGLRTVVNELLDDHS